MLAGDGRDGVALGGADAPIFGFGGGGGADAGGGGAERPGGVGFDLVALFVVGCDDGSEFCEVDFQRGDAAPLELVDGSVGFWGDMDLK